MRALTILAIVVALVAPHYAAAGEFLPGNWKLTLLTGPGEESVEVIAKIEQAGGKWKVSLVGANTKGGVSDVKSVTIDGGQIQLTIDRTGTDYIFEGVLTGTKSFRGSYGAADRLRPANFSWTDENKLDQNNSIVRHDVPESLKQLNQLRTKVVSLRRNLVQADDDKAKNLRLQIDFEQKRFNSLQPELLKDALTEVTDPIDKMDVLVNLSGASLP